MKVDLVGVIESAYSPEGSDEQWLTRLVEAARPSLDEGLGATGFFYDVSNPEAMRVWAPVLLGTPPGAMEALYTVNSLAPASLAKQLFRVTAACETMSERFGGEEAVTEDPLYRQFLAPIGVMDFLSVAATDPSGAGCLIGAPLPRVHRLPRREVSAWNRIAAHISAGSRVRRATADAPDEAAEAILTPSGKVEHATGPAESRSARDALTRSAKDMDRARGKLRRTDPEEAVEIWTALVSGRWTLMDSFDQNGQRYIVARKNDPEVASSAASKPLTKREQQIAAYAAMGHSNKLISYELGLSTSTVAMHLSSAATKLGVKSRVELIQKYRRMSA